MTEPPKAYQENFDYRGEVLQRAATDPDYQALMRVKSAEDIRFFFNTFLWTYDPRVAPYNLPFITYDYEDNAIDWLLGRLGLRDGLIEKTRDMGVTWTIEGVFYHQWLFGEGFLAHMGSKTEDDVDRTGDMKSLFEKLRYFIKTTPSWMLPSYDIRFMRLVNNANGNSITGESANPNFARSGRYKVCFYDEFAATEYANDIWTAMGDSSPCRIICSTPHGTGNKFWKLRFEEMPAEDLLSLHWSIHPKKAAGLYDKDGAKRSPWYDVECSRRTAAEIAQELDIDYLASGRPYFNLKEVSKQEEWMPGDNAGIGKDGKGRYETGILTKVNGKVEFRPGKNGNIRIFEHPGPITQAAIASDPAEGLEHGDKTSIAVRCKKTRNLLAAVYGKFPPEEAGEMELLLSLYYNGAVCTAEMGGYGLVINQFLWDSGANVFRDLETRKGGEKEGKKLGFNTKRHRAEMLNLLASEIDNAGTQLRAKELKVECLNFVNKDGKPQASEGACDDFIFAFAMAGMIIEWYPYSKKIEQSVIGRQRSVYGTERESTPHMGFGFQREAVGGQSRRF